MSNEDLIAGFNSLRKSLTEEEKSALQKIIGKTKPDLEIETFFQCLKTFGAVYKFPNWHNLSISEKELFGKKVYPWYLTLLMFSHDFWERFSYTPEDDLKLQIIVKGSDLKEEPDFVQYNYYLFEKLQECYDLKLSAECIRWVKIEIKKTKQRMDSFLEMYNEKKVRNKQVETKTFPEYLLYDKSDILAEKLKDRFRGEKGLTIRYMIEGLIRRNLLQIVGRHKKSIFKAMKQYFDWYIGTYQSIFDPKKLYDLDLKKVEDSIEQILNSIQ